MNPTFSLFGAVFTLADAQDAPDGWSVVEHLGGASQTTMRWRTAACTPVPLAFTGDDWAALHAMLGGTS